MAALKDQLRSDLTTAMKARDEIRTRTLRMALTAVSTAEVAGSTSRELSDDEVVTVLTKEAKRRREAADAFSAAGRTEQASAERAEGEVLDEYLPAQLGDDEIARIVAAGTGSRWRPAAGPRATSTTTATDGAAAATGLGTGTAGATARPNRRP